jgi:tetratricopeptide (TPR) repeat protein
MVLGLEGCDPFASTSADPPRTLAGQPAQVSPILAAVAVASLLGLAALAGVVGWGGAEDAARGGGRASAPEGAPRAEAPPTPPSRGGEREAESAALVVPLPKPSAAGGKPPARRMTPEQRRELQRLRGTLRDLSAGEAAACAERLQGWLPAAAADGELVFALGEALLCAGRMHEARRSMLRSLALEPPPGPGALELTATLCYTLGFERAAADLAERLFAGPGRVSVQRGHVAALIYLKAERPVCHPRRAEELLRRLIAERPPGTEDAYPPTWMLCAFVAGAREGLGDTEGAALAWEEAARHSDRPENCTERAARVRRRGAQRARVRRGGRLFVDEGEFLTALRDLTLRADGGEGVSVAQELVQLGEVAAREGRREQAAAVWLRAARELSRAEEGEAAQDVLERARRLDVSTDVGQLIAGRLARLLLDAGSEAGASALGLATLAALTPEGAEDLRTPGERLDGLVLLARAQLVSGARSQARRTFAAAEASSAADRRELVALRAALED